VNRLEERTKLLESRGEQNEELRMKNRTKGRSCQSEEENKRKKFLD